MSDFAAEWKTTSRAVVLAVLTHWSFPQARKSLVEVCTQDDLHDSVRWLWPAMVSPDSESAMQRALADSMLDASRSWIIEALGNPQALPGDAIDSLQQVLELRGYARGAQTLLRTLGQRNVNAARQAARDLAQGRTTNIKPPSNEQVLAELFTEWEDIQTGARAPGIMTGLDELDTLLGGLEPGLTIVCGRPSMGKTALLTSIVPFLCHHGVTVDFISLEMSRQALLEKLACQHANIGRRHLREPARMTRVDFREMGYAVKEILKWPLRIWTREHRVDTMAGVEAVLRQHDEGHRVLMLDYLQKMSIDRRVSTMDEALGLIASTGRNLAMDLGAPLLMAAQINRKVEERADKRPLLSDLRGSGEIELHADRVLGMHRKNYYDKSAPADQGEICVIKERMGGQTGIAQVRFRETTATFLNMEDG